MRSVDRECVLDVIGGEGRWLSQDSACRRRCRPFGVGADLRRARATPSSPATSTLEAQGRDPPAPRLESARASRSLQEAPTQAQPFSEATRPWCSVLPVPSLAVLRLACRRMTYWCRSTRWPGEPPRCLHCTSERSLVPMRFVAVCREGHLDDVPWDEWAHSRVDRPAQRSAQRQRPEVHQRPCRGGRARPRCRPVPCHVPGAALAGRHHRQGSLDASRSRAAVSSRGSVRAAWRAA